jgi:hypothetical protein
MPLVARGSPMSEPISPGGAPASPRWPSASASAKIVPGVSDVSRWPFAIAGIGFALIGIFCIVYGSYRQRAVERALDQGTFTTGTWTSSFFEWVARAELPVVANGDFHRREHLATWKTLVPAERTEDAVLACLRSRDPVALTPFSPPAESMRRAA